MIVLSPTLFVAFLGGLLPILLWLAFWLFEDRCEPEPKRYLFYTFVAGMVSIAPALFFENMAMSYVGGTALLLAWAFTEELLKFSAAYVTSLRSYVFDEPLDAVIYMVTAALGFSAMENTLFILGPLHQGLVADAILTGDLRFIGATLLHTLGSATVGIAMALSFYKSRSMRLWYSICGVVLATLLHTLFNFFILEQGGDSTFWTFLCIWFGIIAILLLFERVKQPARDYC